ncbi:MAG: hypothetical protein IKL65_06430 [Bacilli bacterium]|nr:hypothetical protein [Bacilli bacterium]
MGNKKKTAKKTTTKEKDAIKKTSEIQKNINKFKYKVNNVYLSYTARILICLFAFAILMGLSVLFLFKSLKVEEEKYAKYQEMGNLNYKVYLKENDFYETPYLDKGKNYIASLIKNINVDFNYQFIIDNASDMTFNYDVIGKLIISGNQGNNKLYEKEYVLKTGEQDVLSGKNIHTIKDNLSIDYDYYNAIANNFKSTFGVEANSELLVYVRINKKVQNDEYSINLNDSKQMSLTIPLTQRTLEIGLSDTGINNSQSVVKKSEVKSGNIVFGVLTAVVFILAVASLLKLLELLMMLVPKDSKYDKYIKKILNEYDRLIVETPTEPRLANKEIIKIKRFEELLDARDNLKRPIMYHSIVSHQKCYFYIESENIIYLLTIKATDLEG